jgi:dethiobiotin synthetase
MVIDLIPRIADEVLLVSANFLGSINHTILSIEALQSRHIPVKGLIFNGERYAEGEDWITNYTGVSCLGRLNPEPAINASVVQHYAATWNLKTTDDSYEPG